MRGPPHNWALFLEWGDESAWVLAVERWMSHGNYQCCLLSGRSGWTRNIGSSELSWSHSNHQFCLLSGHNGHALDVHARQCLACGRYQPAFSTGKRVVQSPLKWWSHLSFYNRDGATSGRVNDQEWVRDLQRAALMEHPEGPSHVVVSIAERLTRPVSGNL